MMRAMVMCWLGKEDEGEKREREESRIGLEQVLVSE